MASNEVRVRLTAEDKISSKLDNIAKNTLRMTKAMERSATTIQTAYDRYITRSITNVNYGLDDTKRKADKLNGSISNLNSNLNTLFKGYVGFKGFDFLTDKVDDTISTVNRLNYVNYQTQVKTGVSPDELFDASTGGYTDQITNMTKEQMDKIYSASQKVRGSYSGMVKDVSKLTVLAGDSFDNNVDNAIRFQQVMSEAYAIGGASAQEMHSSMYQMVQALGSGRLQGDELRSVREGAPLAYQAIEKFAQGVYYTNESLKDLASEGKITSDIVVKAIMSAGGELDEAFAMTSVTFGQTMDMITSYATKSFEPVFIKIGKLLSTDGWKKVVSEIQFTIGAIANSISKVLDFMIALDEKFPYLINSAIEFLKYLTLAGALLGTYYASIQMLSSLNKFTDFLDGIWKKNPQFLILLATVLAVGLAFSLFGDKINAVTDKIKNFMKVASGLDFISTIVMGLVGLFLALGLAGMVAGSGILATLSPILLVAGVVLLILAILVNVFETYGAKILGRIYQFSTIILNILKVLLYSIIHGVLTLVNPILSVIDWILTVAQGGFDSFGGAVANLLGQIISWFLDLGKVVTKIIDAIFGTSWTSGLQSLEKSVLSWGRKNDKSVVLDTREKIDETLDKTLAIKNPNIARRRGSELGADLVDKLNQGADIVKDKLTGVMDKVTKTTQPPTADIPLNVTDINNSLGNIDDNTKKTADNTSLSEDDVKYLRDLAEMEWKKEYTTASIQIDMNNVNNISSEMDLDGVVTYLMDELYNQAEQYSDGVYI